MKIYILVIYLLIRYDYIYHIYNALFLLKIFIDNFNNKKINRRISFQIRNYKIKNYLITLYFLLRLRYEISKRWKHIDFLKYMNLKHINNFYHFHHDLNN